MIGSEKLNELRRKSTTTVFRFIFLYFILTIAPWYWFYKVPGISWLLDPYSSLESRMVVFFNTHLLQLRPELNMNGGGSGDTSYSWALFSLILVLAATGAIAWSIIHRDRKDGYPLLGYLLRNIVRYQLAIAAFVYGIDKLFMLQMPFPDLNMMSTTVGDLLPMRLSWLFVGYSPTYQFCSGLAEVMAGSLLFFRRTVPLGVLLSFGVFSHVFLLNISYDIPVKLYSMQLMICSMYLLALDWRRYAQFFFSDAANQLTTLYDYKSDSKLLHITRWGWKGAFVLLFVVGGMVDSFNLYKSDSSQNLQPWSGCGVYSITHQIQNGDILTTNPSDPMAWKDLVFDPSGTGSILTSDTLFRQRYGRGYFSFEVDSIRQKIVFQKSPADSVSLFEMNYRRPGPETLVLYGTIRNREVTLQIHRSAQSFQLCERQFHWISESNR